LAKKLEMLQPMARLPKEPAPESLRTFGARPAFDSPASVDPNAPPIESPSPSAYRAKNPYEPPPADYKVPSLLREHRRLAILFLGVAVAFGWYCLRPKLAHSARPVVVAPPSVPAPASAAKSAAGDGQPIFIEAVPETPQGDSRPSR
jgi:hypothetical protein